MVLLDGFGECERERPRFGSSNGHAVDSRRSRRLAPLMLGPMAVDAYDPVEARDSRRAPGRIPAHSNFDARAHGFEQAPVVAVDHERTVMFDPVGSYFQPCPTAVRCHDPLLSHPRFPGGATRFFVAFVQIAIDDPERSHVVCLANVPAKIGVRGGGQ